MTTGAYVLEVDWNNDDDFGDESEDVTGDVLGVECERGRDYASPLTGQSVAGRLVATLLNTSGKYSSFNTSSPIAGNILPGRKVRLRATSPDEVVLWTGFLDRIDPAVTQGPFNTATLHASGAFIRLSGGNAKISPAALSDVATGDVVDAILDAVDWPSGARAIDAGEVPISKWFVEERGALDALYEIQDTEVGFIYEGLDWDIVFESRYHRLLNNATPAETFSDSGAELPYESIDQSDPLREIFNQIIATVQPYTIQSEEDLWTLQDVPFTLSPSQSITYIAQYPGSGSSQGAYVDAWTTPVVGTDIVQSGVANGDIDVSVVKTANKMFITITNDGSDTASITTLKARGTAVEKNDPYQVSASDATSQGKYGLRTYPLPSPWYNNQAYAQAGCDYFVLRQKDPRPIISIGFTANKNDDLMGAALSLAISDRVAVEADNNAALGIDGEFYIESIRHEISQGKMLHRVMFSLSPADEPESYWILGTSELGTSTKLAY